MVSDRKLVKGKRNEKLVEYLSSLEDDRRTEREKLELGIETRINYFS